MWFLRCTRNAPCDGQHIDSHFFVCVYTFGPRTVISQGRPCSCATVMFNSWAWLDLLLSETWCARFAAGYSLPAAPRDFPKIERNGSRSNIHSHIHTIYIHTYIHIYIHPYIYIYTYIHTYLLTYLHTYILKYLHTDMLTCWHTFKKI